MHKLFEKHFIVLLVPTIVVLGTVGMMFFLVPGLEQFRVTRGEMVQAETQYQLVDAKRSALSQFQTSIASLPPAEVKKLSTIFLHSPELSYLLPLFESRAAAASFSLRSFDVASTKEGQGSASSVTIQAHFKGGGYKEFKELLQLFTVSVPLIDITSFTFDPRAAEVVLNAKAERAEGASTTFVAPDSSFFTDPRFRALKDPLEPPALLPKGRQNPFAPLEKSNQGN